MNIPVKINHCCEIMRISLNDQRIGIGYIPKYREYFIDLIYSSAIQGIYHCPFCGKKLPKRLRDNYFEILKNEYQLDEPYDENQTKLIPNEFRSDEWWKKRGL